MYDYIYIYISYAYILGKYMYSDIIRIIVYIEHIMRGDNYKTIMLIIQGYLEGWRVLRIT